MIEDLDDYMFGQMADGDAFEERLFELAAQGQFTDDIAAILRWLKRRDALVLLRPADVPRVMSSGRRVFFVDESMIGRVQLPADAEQVLNETTLDMHGIDRLDAEVCTPDGSLLKRMPEMCFDPNETKLYSLCEAPLARLAVASNTLTHFYGYKDGVRTKLKSISTAPR